MRTQKAAHSPARPKGKGAARARPTPTYPSRPPRRTPLLRRETLGLAAIGLALGSFVAFVPDLPLLAPGQQLLRESFGMGLPVLVAALGVLGGALLRRRERVFVQQWRATFGGLLLAIAALGLLAFLPPPHVPPLWPALDGIGTAGRLGALIIGRPAAPSFLLMLLMAGLGATLAWPTMPHRTWLSARLTVRWTALFYRRHLHRPLRRFLQLLTAAAAAGGRRAARLAIQASQRFHSRPPAKPALRRPALAKPAKAPTDPVSALAPTAPETRPTPVSPPASSTGAEAAPQRGERLPPLSLLVEGSKEETRQLDREKIEGIILGTLAEFGVEEARIIAANQGPTITQFGLEPGWNIKRREVVEREPDGRPKRDADGKVKTHWEEVSRTRVKVSRITGLHNDLALALSAPSIRMEAPVPGRPYVGIEVPNSSLSAVTLRSVIEGPAFQRQSVRSRLALALGKAVDGNSVAADLARMPHLLIAGSTGSGKSVCINSLVTCVLMHAVPEEVRLLMVDPKRVELSGFNDVPHLICPVVVDMDKVVGVLRWVVREMDERYRKLAAAKARNIEGYNRRPLPGEQPLPYLVVIIDELADLMMVAPDEVERIICRLAQLARAIGIHLVVATQRPSVDVITGLIKANFPTRISFAVTSQVDSRTILDMGGAEKLLGRGDMLYMPPDAAKPLRLQGVFVSDAEMERVVGFWKGLRGPQYVENFDEEAARLAEEDQEDEALLEKARRLAEQKRISVSLLQRELRLGYPRASRLMEILEEEGRLGPAEGQPHEIKADETGREVGET